MVVDVGFAGFATGSAVTIGGVTVDAWGVTPDGSTVWDMTPSAGVSATISVIRSELKVAPEPMFFEVVTSGFDTNTEASVTDYDASYHDKLYFWRFGESYTYTAPDQVVSMDAADIGRRTDSQYMQGPMGAHVFRTPGDQTIELAVIEPSSGKVAVTTMNLTGSDAVADPDTYYSGSATIYVDTTGTHASDGGSWDLRTDINAALTSLDASTAPKRIVLERGQTFEMDSAYQFRPPGGSTAVSLRIEALAGVGARPKITTSSGFSMPSSDVALITDRSLADPTCPSATVIQGIEFEGPWNPATESGNWYLRCFNWYNEGAASNLIDDCRIHGWNRGVATLAHSTRDERLYAVNDTVIEDWADYGFWDGASGRTIVLGSKLAQNVDAISNGPKNPGINWHGAYRASDPNRTILASSDFFSSNGWSTFGSIHAVQPAVRWNTSALTDGGARLNMQSCAAESGGSPIIMTAANVTEPSRMTNALIEGCAALAGFQATRVVSISHGGMTFRNNLLAFANTDYNSLAIGGGSRSPTAYIRTPDNNDGANPDAACLAAPILIYNNTGLNMSDTGSGAPMWDNSVNSMAFETVEVENNLTHEPDIGSPVTTYAPLSMLPLFTARYKGYRSGSSTLHTDYANGASGTPDDVTFPVPSAGSSAISGASGGFTASTTFAGTITADDVTTAGRNIGAI